MLAHGAALRSNLFGAEEVEAIARDHRTAGLTPAEVAMLLWVIGTFDTARRSVTLGGPAPSGPSPPSRRSQAPGHGT
jgi:hypothetical protein